LALALAASRVALGMALTALLLGTAAARPSRRRPLGRRRIMALATFALGIALFALFFGLVAACDRL
jgi:Co/Zn/Cd efflux system component